MSFLIENNKRNPKEDTSDGYWIFSTCFLVTGVIFGITGISILYLLKKSFRLFYEENRVRLILTTIYLTIPMFLRVVWDLLIELNPDALVFMSEYVYILDPIFFICCDMIPIAS